MKQALVVASRRSKEHGRRLVELERRAANELARDAAPIKRERTDQ